MPKEPTLERVRKKLEARTSEIEEEYEKKIKELEEKIEQHKRERDARLIRIEKRFRKDFCLTFIRAVGEEDYSWLLAWLVKNREKEIEHVSLVLLPFELSQEPSPFSRQLSCFLDSFFSAPIFSVR